MAGATSVRLTRGDGLLGTGVFVFRLRPDAGGGLLAERFLLAGFLPVWPLGRVRLAPLAEDRYEETPAGQPAPSEVAATYARGLAGLAFVLACVTGAYVSAGESSWFAGLGVLFGGALPLALIGWLDQTLQRRRVAPGAPA